MLVTLCGSTRFEAEFIEAQRQLARAGIALFSLAVLPRDRVEGEDWSDTSLNKIVADLIYFDQIVRSDAILVLGDGYVGYSTSREILWADIQGKKIGAHYLRSDWQDTIAKLKAKSYPESQRLIERARNFFTSKVAPPSREDPTGQDHDVVSENRQRDPSYSFDLGAGRVYVGSRVEFLRYNKPTSMYGKVSTIYQDGSCEVEWETGTARATLTSIVKWIQVRPVP